ncbi:unnamed protein product [Hymenolepis diminuta]|uniref:Secreted phosphoprotein 1 n=1 Tax=Hymenolepis diminuta TaxID=6216 RepID=A0A0R3SC69_HYMDI|nr:unnamed protein product [Hymenolepis diminuta]VUZ55150.1 unnamed protein product [Hymenolepis diminuta]
MGRAIIMLVLSVLICTSIVLALPDSLTGDSIITSGEVESSLEHSKTLTEIDREDDDEHDDDNREENKINVASNSTHNAQTDQSDYIDQDADDDDYEERLEQEEAMRQINDFQHEVYEEGLTAKNDRDDAKDDDTDDDRDDDDDDDDGCFKMNQCT